MNASSWLDDRPFTLWFIKFLKTNQENISWQKSIFPLLKSHILVDADDDYFQ